MKDLPFVHLHTDLLEVLPALAHGAQLAVFVCIGLFAADPRGATVEDIVDHTGLSEPTVAKALRFLEKSGWVGRSAHRGAPPGRPYYRPLKYLFYRGPQSLIQSEAAKKNFFSAVVDINTLGPGEKEQPQQYCAETRNFFAQAQIREPALSRLSERVAPEIAREWCEWLKDAPDEFTNPVGFMVSQLLADAHALPPDQRARSNRRAWYADEYADLVNR